MTSPAILIAGGYGVVGAETARLLRRHYPDLPLLLGGRSPEKGAALAAELGNAKAVRLNLEAEGPLLEGEAAPAAVLAALHDGTNRLLDYALTHDAAYVDIARAGDELTRALVFAAQRSPARAVIFASNWMAGVPATLAADMVGGMSRVTRLDLSILFYGKDRGGPDSATAVDGIDAPFISRAGKAWRMAPAMTAPLRLRFPSGKKATAYRVNMPDVLTLPLASGAENSTVRLAVDDPIGNFLSMFLLRSRLWKLLPRETRRGLIHNPGPGARHEIVIEAEGFDGNGKPARKRLGLLDPQGQVHLTAIGAFYQLERALGFAGDAPLRPGPAFSETAPAPQRLRALLKMEGVEITGR
ncbi:hypothetical protein ACSHT0_13920 [Tepidicaulis sp. LMO-SS28]|uniref:hypothetical protein n=1 Tax=Tepidicaulis sp. LMO-SS28 TaxID=3447455 RepID=UPI003EE2AB10